MSTARSGSAAISPTLGTRLANSALGQRFKKIVFQSRGPEAGEVFLNQRRVFALPTSAGLMFGGLLVALLLGSINYTLSLGYGLTFLMASLTCACDRRASKRYSPATSRSSTSC
jgi:hypothetical protein